MCLREFCGLQHRIQLSSWFPLLWASKFLLKYLKYKWRSLFFVITLWLFRWRHECIFSNWITRQKQRWMKGYYAMPLNWAIEVGKLKLFAQTFIWSEFNTQLRFTKDHGVSSEKQFAPCDIEIIFNNNTDYWMHINAQRVHIFISPSKGTKERVIAGMLLSAIFHWSYIVELVVQRWTRWTIIRLAFFIFKINKIAGICISHFLRYKWITQLTTFRIWCNNQRHSSMGVRTSARADA